MTDAITQVLKYSLQEFEDNKAAGSDINLYTMYRGDIMPARGDFRRDLELLYWYYNDHNWLIRGAFSTIAKQIASHPFEIKGGDEHKVLVGHYENVLSESQFELGFRTFILMVVLDYLRYDMGGLVEIIGAGNPNKAVKGRVLGIAHLDSLRCRLTGVPEYPVDYWPQKTGLVHRLPKERIARLVDMPDGTEEWRGLGDCALSRAVSIMQQEILMSKYNMQRLDDLPPSGLLILQNIKNWEDHVKLFEASRRREGSDIWANVQVIESLDPDKPANAVHIPFSTLPEHFDYEKYVRIQVNALALALNVDPQDIWPLSGQALGTGTQSEVLHSKAAGKMLGDLRTAITRMINFQILPKSLEFQFKVQDSEQDKTQADTEEVLARTAVQIKTIFSPEIAAQYLVNASQRFADVLLDEQGQLRLPSEDPKPPEGYIEPDVSDVIADEEVIAGSETPTAPEQAKPEEQITTDSETPTDPKQKDVQATRLDFEADVEDAIQAARTDDVSRRRFGVIMRGHISKYGRKAYQDGLIAGGVEDEPTPDDIATIASMVAEQGVYVSNLGETLFSVGITDEQFTQKPAMWWDKSIYPFFLAGVASADKDGLYEFVYGDTEHCSDCLRLNGQKHRMSGWLESDMMPKSSNLECQGFNCSCELIRTTGRARGSY